MTYPPKPTLGARLRAAVAGEKATAPLEALRVAGRAAYDEWMAAERLRAEQALAQSGPWAAAPGTCSQLLAAWNAFTLQTLGEALLDADYLADQSTVGFAPAGTYDQVFNLLSTVQGWVSRARQAAADPGYDLAAQLDLPVKLPAWVKIDPVPTAHLTAMLSVASTLGVHADAALHALERSEIPQQCSEGVRALKQLAAEAAAGLDYARALHSAGNDPSLRGAIASNLKRSLDLWFRVGQMVSMPGLLSRPGWKDDKPNSPQGPVGEADVRTTVEMIMPNAGIATALFEAVRQAGADVSLEMAVTLERDRIRVHVFPSGETIDTRIALLTTCAQIMGAELTKNAKKPFSRRQPCFKVSGVFNSCPVEVWTIVDYDQDVH